VGLRDEKKQQQRQAIVDTALALFRDRGFDQTRVADVTDRLRISETTFFNYFATKQAVLEAAAEDMLNRSTAELVHDVEGDPRPVLCRLEELIGAFARNFAGDREVATLLATHTRLLLDRLREAQVHLLLARLFEEGRQRGEIRPELPPSQLAELFQALILTTIANWLTGRSDNEPLDQRLLRAWQILRCGLEPPATPTRPTKQRTSRNKTRP
jgi:AcrR family transcriptional regulator